MELAAKYSQGTVTGAKLEFADHISAQAEAKRMLLTVDF